jgi:hypothetical protein
VFGWMRDRRTHQDMLSLSSTSQLAHAPGRPGRASDLECLRLYCIALPGMLILEAVAGAKLSHLVIRILLQDTDCLFLYYSVPIIMTIQE